MIFATIVIIIFWNVTIFSRQTFVLMKMSLKPLDQDEYIHLSHTSSKDVFKTSCSRPIYSSWSCVFKTSSRYLAKAPSNFSKTPSRLLARTSSRHEDVFKTSSKRLQDVLQNFLQDIFKKFSGHFQEVFQWCFQEVFKTYHLAKLFLLICIRDVFNTFLRRTAKTVIYRRICLGQTSKKLMVSVQNLQEW